MKRFTRPVLGSILAMLMLTGSIQANSSLQSVEIDSKNTDRLIVSLSAPITLDNATGFRLVGGSSRIERLLSGSGTAQLIFKLTDHVLPDDRFEFLYWAELGNAYTTSGKAGSIEKTPVTNQTKEYQGDGQLYYVSTNGSDSNNGKSEFPFRTIDKAQSVAQPGDYILLKRGDTFKNTYIEAKNSGREGKYITFAAYGIGNKPVIEHESENTFTIADRDYIQVDNLHFKVHGSGETGVYITGNSKNPVVSNCRIEGFGSCHYGVNYGINDGAAKIVEYPQVLNNYITGFRWNIRSSGYPYNGTHEVKGGLIENNRCADNRAISDGDGISAQRGKFHGLIIRKNEIYGYYDDGIDLFSADNVIAEYNIVHSPQQPSASGQGIKAGGLTRSDIIKGHQATNIIVRYNTVYNIYNRVSSSGSQNGIQTNSGSTGKVYGNLVYDVQGHGIIVSGPIENWEVHHNTVINAGQDGLQLYTEGAKGGNVAIRNNILEGKVNDLRCIIKGGKKAIGERNILLSKPASGQYEGRNDIRAKKDDLFANPSQHDYQLKAEAMAIDAGITVEDYKKSCRGLPISNKHDIGAFEFEGSAPRPAPAPSPAPEPSPAPAPTPQPGPTPSPAPSPELLASVDIANPTNGVQYAYYEGSYSKLPDFAALKAVKSGKTAIIDLSKRNRDNDIAFVFTGYFKAPKDGVYTFYTTSDDGSHLFIGEHRVVDNDGIHPAQERSGSIGLKAGFHPIKVTFFERNGEEILNVQITPPGSGKRSIAADELFVEEKEKEEPTPEPTPNADNGLNYRYYEGSWLQLPDFSKLRARQEGRVKGFDLSVRQREENFGIVYYGSIQIDQGGDYTFYTNSDDGSMLYIDGKLVVDNDGVHAPQERSGKVSLRAGRHDIEVRFFERTIGQVLEVRYASAEINKQRIPESKLYWADSPDSPTPTPDQPVAAKPGLRYKYYEGRWGALPNFGSLKVIKRGELANFSLSPARTDRYFGIVYTGYIKIDNSGKYTFYTKSDDGSKLYINGKQLVDNDRVHAARERSGSVRLSAGYHKIEVRYFENAYGQKLTVSYRGPRVSKRAIPDEVLFMDKPGNTKTAVVSNAKSDNAELIEKATNQLPGKGFAKIYPNPASEVVNVQMNAQDASVTITLKNMAGHVLYKRVLHSTLLTQTEQIDLSSLKSGMYLVSVEGANTGSHSFRLIRE